MDIYNLNDLKFVALKGVIVEQKICSCCAKCRPMDGGYMAKLPMGLDNYFPFYICSDECMKDFRDEKRREQTDRYINDCIRMAKDTLHSRT